MTDLEKFIELYKSVGIDLAPRPIESGVHIGKMFLHLENYYYKFEGYPGFFSNIVFDENGKFVKQGFWE